MKKVKFYKALRKFLGSKCQRWASNNLIENIYLLIDLEKIFQINKMIVFVNLKQYLTKEELKELYKYVVYNKISIILIDNQSYNLSLENEKKLLIDNNLEEYML